MANRSIQKNSVLAATTAVALLCSTSAWAELRVRLSNGTPWSNAVSALQSDVQAQGRSVEIIVEDAESSRRARCEDYTLVLDPVGSSAFSVGACNPATGATSLLLRDRSALFEQGDIVPRPRTVALTAVETRRTSVTGGGVPVTGGSELRCSVGVRPFLRDLQRGVNVFLEPGRFVLRPYGATTTATANGQGWTLSAAGRSASISVEYDVVDTQRNEVVLHETATLSCGVSSVNPSPVVQPTPVIQPVNQPPQLITVVAGQPAPVVVPTTPNVVSMLTPGVEITGTTRGRPNVSQATCGANAQSADVSYWLRVDHRSQVSLRLSSNFDAVLHVRSAYSNRETLEYGCNDDAPDTRHSALDLLLEPGWYAVVVDGYSTTNEGEFRLQTTVSPVGTNPVLMTPSVVPMPVGVRVPVRYMVPDQVIRNPY